MGFSRTKQYIPQHASLDGNLWPECQQCDYHTSYGDHKEVYEKPIQDLGSSVPFFLPFLPFSFINGWRTDGVGSRSPWVSVCVFRVALYRFDGASPQRPRFLPLLSARSADVFAAKEETKELEDEGSRHCTHTFGVWLVVAQSTDVSQESENHDDHHAANRVCLKKFTWRLPKIGLLNISIYLPKVLFIMQLSIECSHKTRYSVILKPCTCLKYSNCGKKGGDYDICIQLVLHDQS